MQAVERIKVFEGFVAGDMCRQIINSIDSETLSDVGVLSIYSGKTAAEMKSLHHKKIRQTKTASLTTSASLVDSIISRIVGELGEPEYGLSIESWEPPQLLVYPEGGHYTYHVDAEARRFEPGKKAEWCRIADRDISLILYLNEEFEGGGLYFPKYNLTVRPRTGTVVTFPSCHEYVHGALPVTQGVRYVIVSWLAAFGTPRAGAPSLARVNTPD